MTLRPRLAATAVAVFASGMFTPVWAAQGQSFTVDCGRGQTISGALERGDERKPLILLVRGACTENVIIARDDVTLQGDPASGATISGSGASATITVRASRVLVDRLNVRGGTNGIALVGGSNVDIANCDIQFATLGGVGVTGTSSVTIRDSILQHNGTFGLRLSQADVAITNSRIEFNASDGVRGVRSSSLSVNGGAITSNGVFGISLQNSSEALLTGVTISSNGTSQTTSPTFKGGVSIASSSAQINNSSIVNNLGRGVSVNVGGSLGVLNSMVTGNAAEGVVLYLGATGNLNGGTINGNSGNGVWLGVNSSAQMTGGITIQSNAKHGIELSQASKLWIIGSPIAVGGNAWYGLYCNDAESSAADTALISLSPSNGAGGVSCTGY